MSRHKRLRVRVFKEIAHFVVLPLCSYKFQNLVSEGVTLLDNRAGHGLIKLQEKRSQVRANAE